jgi:pimeloyl-ACP methyl ester carboxylesterase
MIPIVLLPGALGSKDQLDSLAALLTNSGRKVYSLNFSGHGGEPFSSVGFGIEIFANDVVKFLDQNNLKQVDLFGYSMGGYVALRLALQNADYVNRIITLGTKFDWSPDAAEKEVRKLNPAKIIAKVPAFARLLETRHSPIDWKELMSRTATMMTGLGSNPFLNPDTLQTLSHSVTILLGDNDDMADRNYSRQVASWLPNGEFYLLPETFHPIEKVQLELLVKFLS